MISFINAALVFALSANTVRDGCVATKQWHDINIPISSSATSTEIQHGQALFGKSAYLGSLLLLRNGHRYYTEANPSEGETVQRSLESADLLRRLGIRDDGAIQRGRLWPIKHRIPDLFPTVVIDCF
jgi:hypothetical protein